MQRELHLVVVVGRIDIRLISGIVICSTLSLRWSKALTVSLDIRSSGRVIGSLVKPGVGVSFPQLDVVGFGCRLRLVDWVVRIPAPI